MVHGDHFESEYFINIWDRNQRVNANDVLKNDDKNYGKNV